ncbi:hypothetical protein COY33_02170 [candidate division WWE3 bacterium CG_4_10_14_0_2_um_filter_42_7]|uniref:Uncharacterized protein n=2 Tax=Katanobacteria TaxID=422282 RepID=A0A2H0XAK8_UNCKA|nr:MAG: hypothetical protein COT51_00320 [candidate division WWE3 bacterium CG08_land_8_20_14_0_20_41_15]PIZ43055.1 MAG: hypothetical protein COY33_02170 [candidate division WWE3 bacterium CG_4_10_14_0_2_um_filter_42_7]
MNPEICRKLVGFAENRKPEDDVLTQLRAIVEEICGCPVTERQAVGFLGSFTVEFLGERLLDNITEILLAAVEKISWGKTALLAMAEELLSALALNSVIDSSGNFVCSARSGVSGPDLRKLDQGREF